MLSKQIFAREANEGKYASFKTAQISEGQVSDRWSPDICTLLSLLFATKFSSARKSKKLY